MTAVGPLAETELLANDASDDRHHRGHQRCTGRHRESVQRVLLDQARHLHSDRWRKEALIRSHVPVLAFQPAGQHRLVGCSICYDPKAKPVAAVQQGRRERRCRIRPSTPGRGPSGRIPGWLTAVTSISMIRPEPVVSDIGS